MKYDINCYSDLATAKKEAHRKAERSKARIQKDFREMKESFTPLGIISNISGLSKSSSLSWPVLALAIIRKAKKAIKG